MQAMRKVLVSIIIVNYNTKSLLLQCLDSISKYSNQTIIEVIVVDNASTDGSIETLKSNYKDIVLIENTSNIGFSRANNIGIRIAQGNYLLLLNSDTILLKDSIEPLVSFLDDHPDVSIVGPKLLNADMSLQRSWFNFPSSFKTFCHIVEISKLFYKLVNFESIVPIFLRSKFPAFMQRNINNSIRVDYLLLACLMVRRNVFDQIGLLDENLFFYHEDCDLGYRARANNLSIFYCPRAQIIHIGGSTSSKFKLPAYRSYFKSLVYVVSKHENVVTAYGMRLFIVIGMLIRVGMCFFGFYRDINKIGVYKSEDYLCKNERPKIVDVLTNYFQIISDIFIAKPQK